MNEMNDFTDDGIVGIVDRHTVTLRDGAIECSARPVVGSGRPTLDAPAARELAALLIAGAKRLERMERPGALLRNFREEQIRTMGDIAKAWGMPVTFVSDIECGKRLLDDTDVEKVAAVYGLTDTQYSTVRDASKKERKNQKRRAPLVDAITIGQAGSYTVYAGELDHIGQSNVMVQLVRKGPARLLGVTVSRALAALLNVASDSLEARVDREIARGGRR